MRKYRVRWWGKITGTMETQAEGRVEAMKKIQSVLDRMPKSFVKQDQLVPKSLCVSGATWTKGMAKKVAKKPAVKKVAPKKPVVPAEPVAATTATTN